ncbi:hypothetical protein V8E36_007359 [Tilletia maclaganii]
MSLQHDTPLPPSGRFIQAVRESCAAARTASDISISQDAIDAFLRGLDEATFERLKVQHGVNFPLNFSSAASEINFLSVLALLNTLSAYRTPFHQATGQGAYQNVMRLLMGMYISSPDSDTSPQSKLSAQGLANLNQADVAALLGVSLHEEKPHDSIPGLIVGTRGGPLLEPVELVVQICNDTGKRLLDMKAANLGEFVIQILKEANAVQSRSGDVAACELFIEKLVSGIPGFADMTTLPQGQSVYLFKKAFFLLYALRARLPKISSDLQVPDPSSLPMFVDNVIPTMIVHFKILQFGPSAPPALRQWAAEAQSDGPAAEATSTGQGPREGPVLSKEDAYRVRAAALDAGAAIVARIPALVTSEPGLAWLSKVSEVDIDGYLWTVAKDDAALRKIPRLVEKGTVMY